MHINFKGLLNLRHFMASRMTLRASYCADQRLSISCSKLHRVWYMLMILFDIHFSDKFDRFKKRFKQHFSAFLGPIHKFIQQLHDYKREN